MRIRYFFVRFWFIVRAASWKHFHLNGFDFNFFILFTKLIHLGWSFKSSVLAPRRQPWCHAYVSTSWGRKLPNLGKINANGIDCQEQVRVYWWHIDSLIYNGQDTINNSNLDSLQKNSCLMDPQFCFSRNCYKYNL